MRHPRLLGLAQHASAHHGAPSPTRYGPCDIPGVPAPEQTKYAWFEQESCGAVTPQAVLQRLCARMETDEPLYQAARWAFDARVAGAGASLVRRAQLLNQAGAALALQAKAQASLDPRTLAGAVGVQLSHQYKIPLPNGFIWDVDEFASWYKPHERARLSCANCSGDVVPEFDLVGCWPLWAQFGPDELRFRCTRRWSADPGANRPVNDYTRPGSKVPLPCWQTCWETMRPNASAPHGRSPTCLLNDAPPPGPGGVPGPSCAGREVQCTPSCGTPLRGALREFWADWEKGQAAEVPNLAIGCPCGPGG